MIEALLAVAGGLTSARAGSGGQGAGGG